MEDQQRAQLMRIVGQALIDIAEVLEGTPTATAAPRTPIVASVPALPAWEARRVAYLQAYVDAGGELTLSQVKAAGKAAGMGNPGSVTSHGYVEVLASGNRRITDKGKTWLEARAKKSA